jgi:SAM-dependent methyltransferase
MEDINIYFLANQKLWNNKVDVHVASDFYNVEKFKAGDTSLNAVELKEMGDVNGKTLLHLQCHFGMDTISWARKGAITTGLDFSDKAISQANQLAKELQVNSRFVCANVYDTDLYIREQFDIVFTSYGTIGWLPDLKKWANVIAERLKPGAMFYMVDFHPIVWMFDNMFTRIQYPYFNEGKPFEEVSSGTYADRSADLHDTEYGWNHSISDILNSLIEAGLTIEFFNEHKSSPYHSFRTMTEVEPGSFQITGLENKIPLLFSLKATKPTN